MTVTELPPGLESDKEETPDLSISREVEIGLYRQTRVAWVQDYHKLRIAARLNELVESTQIAQAQREQMTKLVRQIQEIDATLRQLEK